MRAQPTYRIHRLVLHDETASWVAIVETAHTERDMQQGHCSHLIVQRHIDNEHWAVLALLVDGEPRSITPRALDQQIGEALDARLASERAEIPGTIPLADVAQPTGCDEQQDTDVEEQACEIERQTRAQARRLTVTETAKLVRRALKDRFPSTKFSVRSNTYAGGASIEVRWTDGPTEQEVEQTTSLYQGASFDGSTDMLSYYTTLLSTENGMETVRLGADFVTCQRDYSEEFTARVTTEIETAIGEPLDDHKRYEAVIWDAEDGSEITVRACPGALERGSDLLHRLRHWRAQ